MTVEVNAQLVAKNIHDLQDRLAQLSQDRDVRIVAVTKGFGVDAPRAALAAGREHRSVQHNAVDGALLGEKSIGQIVHGLRVAQIGVHAQNVTKTR